MSEVKTLVCLANSRKPGGRCIAERSFVDGKVGAWIRPVGSRSSGEVHENKLQYGDGDPLCVLDIIDVQVLEHVPWNHQQENWLLRPESPLVKRGRVAWNQLGDLLDDHDDLWMSGDRNDRVAAGEAYKLSDSLRFIYVENMTLLVRWPPRAPGQKFRKRLPQVRAIFECRGHNYNIAVTDPACEKLYRDRGQGYGIRAEDTDKGGSEYEIGECYITVSLGESWEEDGYCYKLAAAVIERRRA